MANLVLGRVGVVCEEALGAHDHAGCAVATLKAVVLVKGLLDRVESLDRRLSDRAQQGGNERPEDGSAGGRPGEQGEGQPGEQGEGQPGEGQPGEGQQ